MTNNPLDAPHHVAADDLALGLSLADVADAISLPRFGAADLSVSSKPDLTPVSDADLAVEQALRRILDRERPADSVLGEEFGDSLPGATRRWVIDPIDGTKNFVRGVPIWATLIALMDRDNFVLGVVSAPALARRWWASAGAGAHTSFSAGPARRIRVSGVSTLADASLSCSDYAEWDGAPLQARGFRSLLERCWRTRAYGDFYSHVLVAEGAVDLAAEPELSLWDFAALVPIVIEAGGQVSEVSGLALTAASTSLAVSNRELHRVLIQDLNAPEA